MDVNICRGRRKEEYEPASKDQIQSSVRVWTMDERADAGRDSRTHLVRPYIFSGANGD